MKKIVLLLPILSALLFFGCSYKNEAINLESYKSDYFGSLSKDKRKIKLSFVKDLRSQSTIIGYMFEGGKRNAPFYSYVDFAQKYRDGLLNAMKISGIEQPVEQNEEDMAVEIYIKNIELIYSDIKTGKNLEGLIEIEAKIYKNGSLITQNFRQKAGKWIQPSYSSKDLEPFLYELFSDSIGDIVSRLTKI